MTLKGVQGGSEGSYSPQNLPPVTEGKKAGFTARIADGASKMFSRIQTTFEKYQPTNKSSEPTNKEAYLAIKGQFKKFTGLNGKTKKEAADASKVGTPILSKSESAKKPSFISNIPSNIINALRNLGKSTPKEVIEIKKQFKNNDVQDALKSIANGKLTNDQINKHFSNSLKEGFSRLEGMELMNAMAQVYDNKNIGKFDSLKTTELKEKCFGEGLKNLGNLNSKDAAKVISVLGKIDSKRITDFILKDENKQFDFETMKGIINELMHSEVNRDWSNIKDGKLELGKTDSNLFFRENSITETLPFAYMKKLLDNQSPTWQSGVLSSIGEVKTQRKFNEEYISDINQTIAGKKEAVKADEVVVLDKEFYTEINEYMSGGKKDGQEIPKETMEKYKDNLDEVLNNLANYTSNMPKEVKELCGIMKDTINNPELPDGKSVIMRNLYLKVLVPNIFLPEGLTVKLHMKEELPQLKEDNPTILEKDLGNLHTVRKPIYGPILQSLVNGKGVGASSRLEVSAEDTKALENKLLNSLWKE